MKKKTNTREAKASLKGLFTLCPDLFQSHLDNLWEWLSFYWLVAVQDKHQCPPPPLYLAIIVHYVRRAWDISSRFPRGFTSLSDYWGSSVRALSKSAASIHRKSNSDAPERQLEEISKLFPTRGKARSHNRLSLCPGTNCSNGPRRFPLP